MLSPIELHSLKITKQIEEAEKIGDTEAVDKLIEEKNKLNKLLAGTAQWTENFRKLMIQNERY